MDDQERAVRDAFLAPAREPEPVMLAHDACWADEWRQLHKQNLDWALERCTVSIVLRDGQYVPESS